MASNTARHEGKKLGRGGLSMCFRNKALKTTMARINGVVIGGEWKSELNVKGCFTL